MFLEGKSFPSGQLTEEKYRHHVYDIVNMISNDQYLEELLSFDHEQFFKVLASVFTGKPLRYLVTQKGYLEASQVKGVALCPSPETLINDSLVLRGSMTDDRKVHFYRFVVAVQAS